MNPILISRLILSSESTGKYKYAGKNQINGNKRRRYNEYKLKTSNNARRKQTKVNYDTWRRPEMPMKKDEELENLHYSNFLGDKYRDNGASYNNIYDINLMTCDCMCNEEQEDDNSYRSLSKRADLMDADSSECSSECAAVHPSDALSELSLGSNEEEKDFDWNFPIEWCRKNALPK